MPPSATETTTVTNGSPQSSASPQVEEVTAKLQYTRDFGILPIPKRLRYDPDKPFHFSKVLNVSFGFAATFTVANLYYCQPLLVQFSKAFDVTYEQVSLIPTLIQAGYATGLVLITPMGDLVRRRQLILLLVLLTTTLSVGLAVTSNLIVFEVLCYFVGMFTVVPQIMLPLAADLAPPQHRANALMIVLSGLLFGVLIARLLAGIIAEFSSFRVVYYFAIGVQSAVFLGIYLLIPDYESKNPDLTYLDILWTMAKYAVSEPTLIQGSMINFAGSATFANFWVTLTFLLDGPPYHYSTLVIGLFALVGMVGVALGPFAGKVIDKLVPWWAALFGTLGCLLFQAVQTGAGGIHIAAVVASTIGLDTFRATVQTSCATAIFAIEPKARARLNAIYLLTFFLGQVMGTSVGTKVFVQYGWRWAAALNMFLVGWQLFALAIRGPHVSRHTWIGWEGGWRMFPVREKDIKNTQDSEKADSFKERQLKDESAGGKKDG
ncbi:MFS superfamily [Flagelloscypha sp. PMI_526]|nr:MFS superfamily [Flagelloscypha sp. PMI_526]